MTVQIHRITTAPGLLRVLRMDLVIRHSVGMGSSWQMLATFNSFIHDYALRSTKTSEFAVHEG